MSELKVYQSSFTGPEVDSLLTKVKDGSLTAGIEKELSEKADVNGRYPEMSVGFADDLVGRGESVPAEFSFRASGGKSIKDGAARIKRLKGNSVVWNNMVDTRHLQGEWSYQNDFMHLQNGHIYAFIREIADAGIYCIPVIDGVEKYDYQMPSGVYGIVFTSRYNTTPSTTVIYNEKESGACNLIDLTLMFGAGNEPTTIEEYNARKPIVADEYAYNEGEVIHMTAEGIKSVGDNAWDEEWRLGIYGSSEGIYVQNSSCICNARPIRVLPNTEYYFKPGVEAYAFYYDKNMIFIKYEGGYGVIKTPSNAEYLNFYLGAGYGTQYNNDITISLYHSGWKAEDAKYQPYWEDRLMFDKRIKDAFPNGMQRWDMVYNKNGKGYIVKGTGVVDLGNTNWYDDTFNGVPTFTTKDVTNGVMRSMYGSLSGSIIALYSEMTEFRHLATSDNKVFVFNSMAHAPNTLAVRDTAYTNASEFKAAMNGVMFYYQLAEPTIIEYDEPFNLDYRVADFGTEEIIAPQPSAPISADIIYQFNAVDMIREHELEITELQRIIATMQAQLTSLTSNNNN